MTHEISGPPVRYFGSKFRLRKWIHGFFPPHVCFVDAYGGGGSIVLTKTPAKFDVYNDADSAVYNFFRVLRDRRDDLLRSLTLTPYSRQELRAAINSDLDAGDPVDLARRFLVKMWQGRGAHEATTGWRFQRTSSRNKVALADWTSLPRRLETVAERLREIYIEHDDALAVIRRFDCPSTLHYIDPPYLASTRSKSPGRYRHEMRHPKEHRILHAVLEELEGMVVLSHPVCELYEDLYAGWERCDREASGAASNRYTESVWLNAACVGAQRQKTLSLFH